jgi:hypothetical protein
MEANGNFKICEFLENRNPSTGRGNCKSCYKQIQWTRDAVRGHKRKTCVNATQDENDYFQDLTNRKKSRVSDVYNQGSTSSSEPQKEEMSSEKRRKIDKSVANFFYRTGISFRIAESSAFIDMITELNEVYAKKIPSSRDISGRLLDEAYDTQQSKLLSMIQSRDDLTLISDGWTNIRSEHIVNFCIKSPNHETIFYKSINTSGIVQNAENIAREICNVITEIGSSNFSHVMTDNAPVMRASWKIIEETFPHISANGCSAHGINLIGKDISNIPDHKDVISKSNKIIQFVKNHHLVKAKYDEERVNYNVKKTLSTPVPTRWLSQSTSATNLNDSKRILMGMAIDDYESLKRIDPPHKSVVALNLMKNTEFWAKQKKFADIIKKPAQSILKLESDSSSLALAYEEFMKLYDHFEGNTPIQNIIKDRLEFMLTDTMGLSYILTPKHAAEGRYLPGDKEKFMRYAEEFVARRHPLLTENVRDEMIQYVAKMSSLTYDQRSLYFNMTSKQYWVSFGKDQFPNLYEVAKPIIEMISSSGSAERAWSIFRFIHSRLRNRLSNEKIEKLVSMYINCAIFDSKDKTDYFLEEQMFFHPEDYE